MSVMKSIMKINQYYEYIEISQLYSQINSKQVDLKTSRQN